MMQLKLGIRKLILVLLLCVQVAFNFKITVKRGVLFFFYLMNLRNSNQVKYSKIFSITRQQINLITQTHSSF